LAEYPTSSGEVHDPLTASVELQPEGEFEGATNEYRRFKRAWAEELSRDVEPASPPVRPSDAASCQQLPCELPADLTGMAPAADGSELQVVYILYPREIPGGRGRGGLLPALEVVHRRG
jgi:hypothetical protein